MGALVYHKKVRSTARTSVDYIPNARNSIHESGSGSPPQKKNTPKMERCPKLPQRHPWYSEIDSIRPRRFLNLSRFNCRISTWPCHLQPPGSFNNSGHPWHPSIAALCTPNTLVKPEVFRQWKPQPKHRDPFSEELTPNTKYSSTNCCFGLRGLGVSYNLKVHSTKISENVRKQQLQTPNLLSKFHWENQCFPPVGFKEKPGRGGIEAKKNLSSPIEKKHANI